MNLALWIIQGLLALLFLFSGGVKLVIPTDQLVKQAPQFSALFLRFIGVCEVLGAVGLILPRLLRIRPGLTPLAAVGLVITAPASSSEYGYPPATLGQPGYSGSRLFRAMEHCRAA